MIEIYPIKSKAEQKRMCLICGMEYDSDTSIYAAADGDKIEGICEFKVSNDNTAKILAIGNEDNNIKNDIAKLMCGAIISFLFSCDIGKISFDVSSFSPDFPSSLGFKNTEQGWIIYNNKI